MASAAGQQAPAAAERVHEEPRRAGGRRPGRRTLAFVATILLAGLFTYLAVRGVNWHRAWLALKHCDAWWLVPGMAAFAVQIVLRAMRWRSLFAHARRPPRGPIMAATLIGYLFNNIMPARAGEAARVVALTQRSEAPAAEIVGTALVERAYDVLSILIIFFCASPWLPHESWFTTAAVLAGVAAAGLAAVIWILAVHGDRPLLWLVRPLARVPGLTRERVEREAATLAEGLSGLREHRVALEALLWSIAAWMMSAVWAWCVLLAFEPSRGFGTGVLVTVVIGLSMIIPSPPAAVGVFEAAGVAALAAYHVHESAALPYALVLHVSNFVPLVLAGVLTLRYAARRPPGLRR
ncbi:MAG TPA: lysylphosphatidylglycerol synthase transmembrane domain-containing protein [Solirubrobacteraceae bacterium]|nr:lysylphosphatidylglycerol synthase transmembrane domain-containing protein [Solirubrobacteraceae bacterium]